MQSRKTCVTRRALKKEESAEDQLQLGEKRPLLPMNAGGDNLTPAT